MYRIIIQNAEGVMLEALHFSYLDEAESTAEAIENLTDYEVVREWEEE